MKKLILFLLILFLLVPLSVMGQDNEETAPGDEDEQEQIIPTWALGDHSLVISVGTIIPLFFDFFYLEEDRFLSASQFYEFPMGGTLQLEWNSFLNNNMALGFDIGLAFAVTYNNTHLIIPITAIYKYIIHMFPFYMPLSIEAGVCVSKISDSIYFGGIMRAGVSFYYRKSTEWDLGGSVKYWWIPELYFGDDPPKEQSAFGNFLDVTFSAVYHF